MGGIPFSMREMTQEKMRVFRYPRNGPCSDFLGTWTEATSGQTSCPNESLEVGNDENDDHLFVWALRALVTRIAGH